MHKNIRCQRAFSLIEISLVLIIFGIVISSGKVIYSHIKLFTSSDVIAKQIVQIANAISVYEWSRPSDTEPGIREFDIKKLKELGVVSETMPDNYAVILEWDEKNSLSIIIFLKEKNKFVFEERGKTIAELMEHYGYGGWLEKDHDGNIVIRSKAKIFALNKRGYIYSKIKNLPQYTPFFIKEMPYDRDFKPNVKEEIFEWGKQKRNENLTNMTESGKTIDWAPAYVDDRVKISWDGKKPYWVTAIVKYSKNKISNVLEYSGAGESFLLTPDPLWVGKNITLSIQIEKFFFKRQYRVKKAELPDGINISPEYDYYSLPSKDSDNLTPIKTDDVNNITITNSPLFVCLSGIQICIPEAEAQEKACDSNNSRKLLNPFSYNFFLSYKNPESPKQNKKIISLISQGEIMFIPYNYKHAARLFPFSYAKATATDCGVVSLPASALETTLNYLFIVNMLNGDVVGSRNLGELNVTIK
ncbi:type II secretion system protein [Escherichia coli]|nr:type II secretion system protein [Escherichia coli]